MVIELVLDVQNANMTGVESIRVGENFHGIRCQACRLWRQEYLQRSLTETVLAVYPVITLSVSDIAMANLRF